MTRGQKVADWYRGHAPWLAVITLAAAAFGYGYCLATVQARADHAAEETKTAEAYRSALDAKDQLISRLAGSAVKASDQAADAASTAAKAADTAAKAVDTATRTPAKKP